MNKQCCFSRPIKLINIVISTVVIFLVMYLGSRFFGQVYTLKQCIFGALLSAFYLAAIWWFNRRSAESKKATMLQVLIALGGTVGAVSSALLINRFYPNASVPVSVITGWFGAFLFLLTLNKINALPDKQK